MSFRVSFILLVLVAVVGGYVFLFELQKTPKPQQSAPWFYDVSYDDLAVISVEYLGQKQVFEATPEGWVFQESREPVDLARWSGIPLLLTGPRSSRVARESIDDPKEYGLDPPQSVFTVSLKSGQQITTLLGDVTPDGVNHYAQVVGSAPLFLIPAAWGDVINRLIIEPPMVTPTPTLAPEAEATAFQSPTPAP
ncbi:MAG: DUF4340 domain-containing protein [Chloroflexi bacterium]|nr:DUF4340 domain-containing protein [Chloroflexota bacterium]